MKIKTLIMAVLIMFTAAVAHAYISDLPILEKTEIVKLNDDKLIDAYMDVVVEIEANTSFHNTSGFSPKEYKAYKDLLKYRLQLLMEIHSRNLELPSFDR